MIRIKAPAKINLFLEVTNEREDGYHELETIFAKISLYDELVFSKRRFGGFSLRVNGAMAGSSIKNNIVYKAAMRFYEAFPQVKPSADIILNKNIPIGAGLGGGSSDAASTLLGLCKLHDISCHVYTVRLRKIAASLGCDVPFFLLNSPAAIGRGCGELLEPLDLIGRLPYIVLVYPQLPVFTKSAYSNLKLAPLKEINANIAKLNNFAAALRRGGLKPEDFYLFNRLESAVFPMRLDIAKLKSDLLDLGADCALMSGSGSACFGLVFSKKKADNIAALLAENEKYSVFSLVFAKI